jgi:hypothetical protein
MVKNLGPTGLGLVGAIFICLSIVLGATAAENPTNLPDLQKGLEESHRQISGLQPYRPYLVPQSSPYQEKIDLKGTHSGEQVSDLKAMN